MKTPLSSPNDSQYQDWLRAASRGIWLFDASVLPPHKSKALWNFIQERYICRYAKLLKLCPLVTSGIASLRWPGEITGRLAAIENLPPSLGLKIESWMSEWFDTIPPFSESGLEAVDEHGFAIARKLRNFLPAECYLEYRPFQEIVMRDGSPIELPVPDEVAGLHRQHAHGRLSENE